jgi:hypothetical protein
VPEVPENIYFELTAAFNAAGRIAVLASGQAVVWYRLAMMSKDGDWILRETDAACERVREVLAERGARYRSGAPLDPRWLAGGWSSHFELLDQRRRRVRCDFFSRPPRLEPSRLAALFAAPEPPGELPVVDVESLIRMKQTQRAKDYPVIGELARLLAPEQELELTTDPDRILELAAGLRDRTSRRPAVRAATEGRGRLAVVVALAEEVDRLQQQDRARVERYEHASTAYREALRRLPREDLRLPGGHDRLLELAEGRLPATLPDLEETTG